MHNSATCQEMGVHTTVSCLEIIAFLFLPVVLRRRGFVAPARHVHLVGQRLVILPPPCVCAGAMCNTFRVDYMSIAQVLPHANVALGGTSETIKRNHIPSTSV